MKKIKLTNGKYAVVDNEEFNFLNQWKWYISNGYASRDIFIKGNRKCIYMHRLINNTKENFVTDHINRNKLDNRKSNLRNATGSQNGINRGLNKNNTSGYKGIIWRKDTKKWQVRIRVNYKTFYFGCYKNIKDAIKARKESELKYHKV